MGQFVHAIKGMDEACRALDYPVVSGNVSLYNETNGQAIPPTPAIGGVGLISDVQKYASIIGAKEGDSLVLIGDTKGWLGASLYGQIILGHDHDDSPIYAPPPVDLAAEKLNGDYVRMLVRDRRVNAVHDLSDGGLALAAIEMAFANQLGFSLNGHSELPLYAWLFGEDQGRYLLCLDQYSVNPVISTANSKGIPAQVIGKVGGNRLIAKGGFDLSLHDAHMTYENWLPNYMAS